MMRLRKIWAEDSFFVLRREHGLSRIRKKGIRTATEECLLATMALNLQMMVKAILLFLHKLKIWVGNVNFQLKCLFCQQVLYYTSSVPIDPIKSISFRRQFLFSFQRVQLST